MIGRKLRVLLINDDTEYRLENPHLDVAEFPDKSGSKLNALMTWEQHMTIWENDEVPSFDLLLVDINFGVDKTDPQYFGENDSDRQDHPNPFGLLHALPLAGRQGLTNMPFVWGIHSGSAKQVMSDPVAIVAFGLLCAMERRAQWQVYYGKPALVIDYFSKRLEEIPSREPEPALRLLIKPYRDRLLESCRSKAYVELDSLQALITAAQSRDEKVINKLGSEPLFIFSGYEEDAIQLRSLFADLQTWDNNTVTEHVLPFLKDLKKVTEEHTDVFPTVSKCIETLNDPEGNMTITQVLPKAVNHAWIGVGVVVCLWLKRHFKFLPCNLEHVMGDLGLSRVGVRPNYHAIERLLEDAGFAVTPQKFLDRLMTEPLPPVWRECGRNYFLNVLQWKRGRSSPEWPACLGSEP